MTHDLKCWPEYFEPILAGIKNFEVRYNDRNFKIGDTLKLREYNPVRSRYTGRWCEVTVTYILKGGHFGLDKNIVVMSI